MNLAHAITLSCGWRRRAIAVTAGALGAFSLAPTDFFPAIAIPLTASVWLLDGVVAHAQKARLASRIDRSSILDAWRLGWMVGFGFFLAGLWWLGAAFLVEADEFAWALPLGVIGLPAVLACFTGFGFVIARCFWSSGPARIVALGLGLASSEWLRGIAFTGFPWNSIGMALGGNLVLAQPASLVGLNGLTLVTILIFASPALLSQIHVPSSRTAVFLALGALGAIALFGAVRLSLNPPTFREHLTLRIMQPNTPQDDKFRPENRDRILNHYLGLSTKATPVAPRGIADVTHVIWPESAFPFFLSRDAAALSLIGRTLGSAVLITGAARMETVNSETLPGEIGRVSYFNAIQVVGDGGAILDSYDKVHLVPFGEYLPLSALLEKAGLRQFVHIPGGFEPGTTSKLLSAPGLGGIVPLVCYEAIFPGVLDPNLRSRANLIVNVTNDGWFGMTPGPYQHLAQARLRSIELGLPLVRSANTGISASIDAYGRIMARLPLGTADVLDVRVTAPAPPTVYSRAPLLSPALFYAACFLLLFLRQVRR